MSTGGRHAAAAEGLRFAAAGVVPRRVVEPESIDEVIEAVSEARASRQAVIPAGNGTHLDVGRPPLRYDVALSTRRLRAILAHDAGDMTVTVEPGVVIAELDRALARHGQWLPLDPPASDAMTVGGLIAADRCGPQRLAYGKVRDLLLGVRAVLSDGHVLRGGARVVKNVAGYDLPKLFAGSYGTLGVIVEATFKVRPRPDIEAVFVWPQPTLAAALAEAQRLLDGDIFPVWLEAINDAAAESLGIGDTSCLLVGAAGAAAHVAEQERRLAVRSRGAATRCDGERGAALRTAVREFSRPADEEALVARLGALPSELPALLAGVEGDAGAAQVVAEIAVHAGSGVAWCQLVGGREVLARARIAERLRLAARERGAWVVYEALPDELRGRLDPWGFDGTALRLMRGVKAALDPTGVFSPGRFVGGI